MFTVGIEPLNANQIQEAKRQVDEFLQGGTYPDIVSNRQLQVRDSLQLISILWAGNFCDFSYTFYLFSKYNFIFFEKKLTIILHKIWLILLIAGFKIFGSHNVRHFLESPCFN